ncbi:hypothetical protein HPC49_19330 [Pyxidicoccus fallax]|uniref:Tetratricopeptide repeat domain protein n=1 Tax=Pyxidicoccus fallax TaxID=394095 RepID=A0A848LD41_9BACT|nr:hypothetical protein [Pyxidicoccus fallax]NMO14181.1 hypothetical protein [Pyxidicoccus fallax]NPC80365.1 hypothetical protein [Pyxidicoccus fallax]
MQCRSLFASLVVLMLLAPAREADACGPDFPPELLTDRAYTLAELPEGLFLHEVSRLVPKPADPFQVVDFGEPEGARTGGGARETALYTEGAKAWHAGDWPRARARFEDVLALPPEERRRFSTFAAYMLGRTPESGPESTARARFAEVRELVRQGFDDPLGLAVASLGEEARLLLEAGDDIGAIRLYAEQAAHGSWTGTSSLLFVARALSRDEARLREALKDPLAQRLMATFAWTRGQEWLWTEDGGLRPLLDALASVRGLAGADRLAAAAWRVGRFDLAERFAGQEPTPLDAWVRAKLALRRGDRLAAEQLLAEAARGMSETEDWQHDSERGARRPRTRAEGERALLLLMRGDFMGSAQKMMDSCSWPDIAYVAERVLTVDELKRFVHAQGPEADARCLPELGSPDDADTGHDASIIAIPFPTSNPVPAHGPNSLTGRLRLLLGRRLLRTGAGAEALEYFRGTSWEQPARQYVDARERARTADDAMDRAQALYDASLLARKAGMEILGTEAAPDWAQVDGMYDMSDYAGPYELPPEQDAVRKKMAELPLTSPEEQQRLTAHAPPHPLRYHYRSTAADLAEQAAALVPPRSQAYAALLCHAARFTAYSEPERSQRLWSTYVKNGALLAGEGMVFGQQCPEPDFERARAQQPKLSLPWKGLRRRTLAALGGGLLLPVALGAALLLRRKRPLTPPRG